MVIENVFLLIQEPCTFQFCYLLGQVLIFLGDFNHAKVEGNDLLWNPLQLALAVRLKYVFDVLNLFVFSGQRLPYNLLLLMVINLIYNIIYGTGTFLGGLFANLYLS